MKLKISYYQMGLKIADNQYGTRDSKLPIWN